MKFTAGSPVWLLYEITHRTAIRHIYLSIIRTNSTGSFCTLTDLSLQSTSKLNTVNYTRINLYPYQFQPCLAFVLVTWARIKLGMCSNFSRAVLIIWVQCERGLNVTLAYSCKINKVPHIFIWYKTQKSKHLLLLQFGGVSAKNLISLGITLGSDTKKRVKG